MKLLVIPHLPKLSTRGFQLAKYSAPNNEVHFVVWSMPFPFTFSNIIENLLHSWHSSTWIQDGVIIHKISRIPFFFPAINKPWFKYQINRIFGKHKLDLIFSESYFNETEPPLDLPMIYDLVDDHEAFINIYGGKLYQWGCRILEVRTTIENQIKSSIKVVTVSDKLVDWINKFKVSAIKIPNGVPKSFIGASKLVKPVRHSLSYVSNFDKFSNLVNVVLAVNRLKHKYPDITLSLIGDGVEIPVAKQIVHRLKLNKYIKFHGWMPYQNIPTMIARAEVSLLPFKVDSLTDSAFPIKLVEYLAAGNKIVSSNLSEVKLIASPNIHLYEDEKGSSNLTIAIDRAFKAKLVINSNEQIALRYTWQRLARQLNSLAKEIV